MWPYRVGSWLSESGTQGKVHCRQKAMGPGRDRWGEGVVSNEQGAQGHLTSRDGTGVTHKWRRGVTTPKKTRRVWQPVSQEKRIIQERESSRK